MPSFVARSSDLELMDVEDIGGDELRRTLNELEVINRLLGGYPASLDGILSPGMKATAAAKAKEAAQRFISEGLTVRIARPPEGMDFNDVLINSRRVAFVENYRNPSNG